MIYRILIISSLPLILFACASPINRSPSLNADYGTYPKNYQAVVKKGIRTILADPDSAKYEDWRPPVKGFIPLSNRELYGYGVCVKINSKNMMGGYTGIRQYYVPIHNNVVTQIAYDEPALKFCT